MTPFDTGRVIFYLSCHGIFRLSDLNTCCYSNIFQGILFTYGDFKLYSICDKSNVVITGGDMEKKICGFDSGSFVVESNSAEVMYTVEAPDDSSRFLIEYEEFPLEGITTVSPLSTLVHPTYGSQSTQSTLPIYPTNGSQPTLPIHPTIGGQPTLPGNQSVTPKEGCNIQLATSKSHLLLKI